MNVHNQKILDSLLICPPTVYSDRENIWEDVHAVFPPLGLASIASITRTHGYSVQIIDCNIYCTSIDQFCSYFRNHFGNVYSQINVVGISSLTCTINTVYKIAQICKEQYPNALVIVGGPHASTLPYEVLQSKYIDIVVVGEGEYTFTEIVSGNDITSVHGIVYKYNNDIIANPPRKRINNLDNLPIPAYDLLPIEYYQPTKGSYKRLPAMSMVTSRGCPGTCTFCFKPFDTQLTFTSAEKIIEHIQLLIDRYNIKQILFYDDTFTVNERIVHTLCDLIIQKAIDITWTCFTCTGFISKDMLKKMKKAGCHQIMYGIENIDEHVLKNINKNVDIEQVKNAIQWTKQTGIECRLAFLVGSPGDTEEIINRNIQFINELNPDYLIVNITTPFPGTAMFSWAQKRDLITTYNWDDYTLAKPVMKLENLNQKQIMHLYKLMYRRFYLRPSYIIKKCTSIHSWTDLQNLTSGFKSLLSFLR